MWLHININFKIYIKINIKTTPTCFGAVTPSSGSALFDIAKVTVVKLAKTGHGPQSSKLVVICVVLYIVRV